jgi:hypothetical protein
MFEEGNCFLIETNYDKDGYLQSHLFILILKDERERVVIVNIDKKRGKKKIDLTTILYAGEGHEFIKEESYVNYNFSELTDISTIKSKLSSKTAKHIGVFDKEVLQRVCDGVLKSDFTPYEVREAFEDRLFREISKK